MWNENIDSLAKIFLHIVLPHFDILFYYHCTIKYITISFKIVTKSWWVCERWTKKIIWWVFKKKKLATLQNIDMSLLWNSMAHDVIFNYTIPSIFLKNKCFYLIRWSKILEIKIRCDFAVVSFAYAIVITHLVLTTNS